MFARVRAHSKREPGFARTEGPSARVRARSATRWGGLAVCLAVYAGAGCARLVTPCFEDGFCPRDASEYIPGQEPSPCGDDSPMVPIDPPGLIVRGLGGRDGTGTDCLTPNDDQYSSLLNTDMAFPSGVDYFGQQYRALYVNTNGNVSFRMGLSTFTPAAFPIAGQPMIAPWWGDVDTRGVGTVCWAQRPGLFFVTWLDVGYFGSHTDRRNTFQLILRARPDLAERAFEAQFRYGRCEWTTGDASGGSGGRGGTPAQVGFDAGDGVNFLTLRESRTDRVLDVCRGTNTGRPGIYRFVVVSGRPREGDGCPTDDGGVRRDASRTDGMPGDVLRVDGGFDL